MESYNKVNSFEHCSTISLSNVLIRTAKGADKQTALLKTRPHQFKKKIERIGRKQVSSECHKNSLKLIRTAKGADKQTALLKTRPHQFKKKIERIGRKQVSSECHKNSLKFQKHF